MENNTKGTTIKRFIAFIFDLVFIVLLAFTVYMVFGLIFKIDHTGYQNRYELSVVDRYPGVYVFGGIRIQEYIGQVLVWNRGSG